MTVISRGRPRVWRESEGLTALPSEWALYRIMEPTGEPRYIGITVDLKRRTSEHRRTGNFDGSIHHLQYQMAAKGVSWDELCAWERRKIQQHQPHGVTYAGGNGRRPAIQINGVIVEPDVGESMEDAVARQGLLRRFMSLFRP